MKKMLTIIVCLAMLFAALPVYAAEEPSITSATEIVLENGIRVVEEIIVSSSAARATAKDATKKQTFYEGDTVIAIIAFQATFRYDGSTVSVLSQSVTQTDTYSGWSYSQNSFTSSGGTVTLSGKLTKWLIFNPTNFTMSLTCDVNGNLS